MSAQGLVASNLNLKPGECLKVRGEVAPDAKRWGGGAGSAGGRGGGSSARVPPGAGRGRGRPGSSPQRGGVSVCSR